VELLLQLHITHRNGENMSNDIKRRIGDNQNPIEESAIKLIKKIYNGLIVQKKHCAGAVLGKNKTARDNAAMNSIAQINGVLRDLEPWKKVIEAKENGVDVHAAPVKSHKLDIVSNLNTESFGQYIIDKGGYEER